MQAALERLEVLAEQAVAAEEEQAESDLSSEEFGLYWVLKGKDAPNPKGAARAAQRILAAYPGWPYNAVLERKVRLELYKILNPPLRKGVAEAPGPMWAEARRAGLLKETVDAILRQARRSGKKRDVALLELLAATGLRASEVAGLRVGDLELNERSG